MRAIIVIFGLMLGLAACGKKEEKTTESTTKSGSEMTYDEIRAAVFKPQCETCHSGTAVDGGGFRYDSYAAVKAKITQIRSRAVVIKDMPAEGMSDSLVTTLKDWIDAGANE